MCLSCGCYEPDDAHGEKRYITMAHLVDAAAADNATVEQAWQNMVNTMNGVLAGKLKSKAWAPAQAAAGGPKKGR
ncbi:MAG: hypothetical protein HYY01_01040 [Chloroflexi bacterium]|nr:hypothetical protein [Chloroflexota bacterium]